jgi:hypothetical protein
MPTSQPTDSSREIVDSPLFLLATLFSARRSKDVGLERVTHDRLTALGFNVMFADEPLIKSPRRLRIVPRKVVSRGA